MAGGDVARARGDREAAPPAPPRPRRSRRHAEVRLRRRPQRARARLGARDRGPRGRRRAGEVAAVAPRYEGDLARDPDGRGHGLRRRAASHADRSRARRRVFAALLRPVGRGRDDRRGQGRGGGRRLARWCGRGARLRRAARARVARALGPQDRRPDRAGAHEHPGHEGRGARRGLRGRGRAGERRARRDPVGCGDRPGTRAARTVPAVPKVA